VRTGVLSAVRCSVEMLQAAETLNPNKLINTNKNHGWGGLGARMMTLLRMMKLLVLLMIM